MARPSNVLKWATNAGTRETVGSAKWAEGWTPGEPVPAKKFNDVIGKITDMLDYFQTLSPTDGVWTVIASGTTYGTLGYSTTSGSWLTLTSANGRSGVQIEAGSATAAQIIRQTMTPGASPIWQVTYDPAGANTIMLKVGALGLIGPTAVASVSTGIRYGYPSSDKIRVSYPVGPELGGYEPVYDNGGALPVHQRSGGSSEFRKVGNASALNSGVARMRRPLVIPYVPAHLSGDPILQVLSATFSGSSTDLEVAVVEVDTATGTETDIAVIDQSAPSATGLAVTLTPASASYFIEDRSTGSLSALGLTNDAVRNTAITVDHQAVVPSVT